MKKKDFYWSITFIIILLAIIVWFTTKPVKENLTVVPWPDTMKCLGLKDEKVKEVFNTIFENIQDKDVQNKVFGLLQKEGLDENKIMSCIFDTKE